MKIKRKPLAVRTAFWLVASTGAWAQERLDGGRDAEAQARALVEALAGGRAADGDPAHADALDREALRRWAESVIGESLQRSAGAVPGIERGLPATGGSVSAESTPGAVPGFPAPESTATAEIIVFASLSMPESSWRQWSRQAAKAGTPLVLRGIGEEGLAATANRIMARRAPDGAGATVDPRLFRLFRIAQVPAVAVVPGGVAPCASPGCSAEPPPPHDLVTGNVGLERALEIVAREDGPGRETARRHLERLRGESE